MVFHKIGSASGPPKGDWLELAPIVGFHKSILESSLSAGVAARREQPPKNAEKHLNFHPHLSCTLSELLNKKLNQGLLPREARVASPRRGGKRATIRIGGRGSR